MDDYDDGYGDALVDAHTRISVEAEGRWDDSYRNVLEVIETMLKELE